MVAIVVVIVVVVVLVIVVVIIVVKEALPYVIEEADFEQTFCGRWLARGSERLLMTGDTKNRAEGNERK